MKLDFLKGYDFFTGVPDSQLKALCNYLMDIYGISEKHIIAANEGNCVGLAAGYHLATGKVPVVYLQNSGIGNIINPVVSLMNDKVYAIPCIFVIGWRGEPGTHDEPQHIFQGEVTLKLLEDIGIKTFVIRKETKETEAIDFLEDSRMALESGKQIAFVVSNDALEYDTKVEYKNNYSLLREEVIKQIVEVADEDLIISTTGKASRELFEIRESLSQTHAKDFLTVGSMGHSSSIALGVALSRSDKKVWCIDGDGAVLMHMGAMALIGSIKPSNLIHIVINNGAHESVGGMPTVVGNIDLVQIAKGCGYINATSIDKFDDLRVMFEQAKRSKVLTFIEIKTAIGARQNLGRPTTSVKENKMLFMGV